MSRRRLYNLDYDTSEGFRDGAASRGLSGNLVGGILWGYVVFALVVHFAWGVLFAPLTFLGLTIGAFVWFVDHELKDTSEGGDGPSGGGCGGCSC